VRRRSRSTSWEFPSEPALQAYLDDDRRTALATERDHAIARTEVLRVELL